jgi:aminopeptidase YwaD
MTSYRFYIFCLIIFLTAPILYGQDTMYAREVISRLCNHNMHGRGYIRHGDHKAAEYIRHEFEKDSILPIHPDYFQCFPISINTFPGDMKVSLNKKSLVPGRDFIIDPASPGLNGSFAPLYLHASGILNGLTDSLLINAANKVIIVDARDIAAENAQLKRKWSEWKNAMQRDNPFKLKGLIEITDEKLVFGASVRLSLVPCITVKGTSFQGPVTSLDIRIKNKYIGEYITRNVMGYIPGTSCPDSFLVYTAHYDHLGVMGKNCFFPGANDNASGVAMMLGLARYFSSHPQGYSVLFVGFTGEEAGLLGSEFFINHPPVGLSKIKFLVNLDLVGTGIEGITVVNATEFPHQFETLSKINDTGQYLVNIKKRGAACNSDHCPFFAKGVPCFFVYTLGGIAAYHNTDDRPETLPLTAFEGLTRLLIDFGEKLY